jgi:hypothetical protein
MKKLLMTTAVAVAVSLGACTSAQIQQAEAQIQDVISTATSVACGIIPEAQTIMNIIAVLYPGASILSLAGPALQAVETEICSAAPPVASARYRSLPRRVYGAAPVTIGNGQTTNVPVRGWGSH